MIDKTKKLNPIFTKTSPLMNEQIAFLKLLLTTYILKPSNIFPQNKIKREKKNILKLNMTQLIHIYAMVLFSLSHIIL